jgi:uncharacterized protein YkwD
LKNSNRCRLALFILILPALASCGRAPIEQPLLATHSVDVDQAEALAMVSEYRREHGLNGLQLDPTLEGAAASQAFAMASANELSHTVAGTLAQRLRAARVPPGAADENVSGGYNSIQSALTGWRKSPPHNANLLDPKMRRMGIGSAYAADSRYHQYWSLILAD